MPDDISSQILAQTSDNIQKLFDLSTRIDERVKAIQNKQEQLDRRIDTVIEQHVEVLKKIAVLESKGGEGYGDSIDDVKDELHELDKRLVKVEGSAVNSGERWKSITSFIVQLVWVILAAYLLTKMNLQAPAVP